MKSSADHNYNFGSSGIDSFSSSESDFEDDHRQIHFQHNIFSCMQTLYTSSMLYNFLYYLYRDWNRLANRIAQNKVP